MFGSAGAAAAPRRPHVMLFGGWSHAVHHSSPIRCCRYFESLNTPIHKHALRAARAALVIAGSFAAADARESRTSMPVTATVLAVARIERLSVPAEVVVTAADLHRGYVDVGEPLGLVIRSNSPAGYALDLDTVTPLFSSLVIRGLESEQSLGAGGGSIVQRWRNAQTATLSLRFRFVLAPGVTAGRYAWPMQVRVRPLDGV